MEHVVDGHLASTGERVVLAIQDTTTLDDAGLRATGGLDDADDLRKCLAFDAITAWRVMSLERLARDHPEMSSREDVLDLRDRLPLLRAPVSQGCAGAAGTAP